MYRVDHSVHPLKLFSRLPDVSVECSSNVVHLRICADSCIALRDLLLYLAKNGDLQKMAAGDEGGEIQLRDYSTLGSELNSMVSVHPSQQIATNFPAQTAESTVLTVA